MKKLITVIALFAVLLLPQIAVAQTVQEAVSDAISTKRKTDTECIDAALSGNTEVLGQCMENGFDPNTKVADIPVTVGALQYPEILAVLASKGTLDINATFPEGRTLLMIASMRGNINLMYELVSTYKADTTLKDDLGKTAADYAKMRYQDMIDVLNGKEPVRTRLRAIQAVARLPFNLILNKTLDKSLRESNEQRKNSLEYMQRSTDNVLQLCWEDKTFQNYLKEKYPSLAGKKLEDMSAEERQLIKEVIKKWILTSSRRL